MPQTRTKSTRPTPRRTQRERSETTTRKLVTTARKRFARDGYQATALDTVVSECGVTKGAFYHHFANKEELFEAVFVAEQRRIVEELAKTYDAKAQRDPVRAFYDACRAYLAISLDPGIQRITLLDALAVLGWSRMREIEAEYGLAMIKMAIDRALRASGSSTRAVEPLAHLLFGLMSEAAMYLAYADDQAAAKRQVERQLKRIIGCVLSP